MFERKGSIRKDKKIFISYDYIRKVFQSNPNSKTNLRYKDNNLDFQKVESIHKINVSNNHPLIIFHKPSKSHAYNFENQLKKDLIENKGYLSDGGYNKKLLKYYSYHNTDQNRSKNLFRSSCSQSKNLSKNNESKNIFNSNRTSFSMSLNKRTKQKDYSNAVKKVKGRPKIKKEEKKEKNTLFNSVNLQDIKYRNLLIEKLTDKNYLIKSLFEISKFKKNKEINQKENIYKRKKDYLDQYNISYDNENNNDTIDKKSLKKNRNNVNINKELKNIKQNNKKIINAKKSESYNHKNNNNNDNSEFSKNTKKKRYKDIINQFEFIYKIKKEFNILRNSQEKVKNPKLSNKN